MFLHTALFQEQVGPQKIYFRGPAQNLGALGTGPLLVFFTENATKTQISDLLDLRGRLKVNMLKSLKFLGQ